MESINKTLTHTHIHTQTYTQGVYNCSTPPADGAVLPQTVMD